MGWTSGLRDRWTGQNSSTSLVSKGGMFTGRAMDVHWTGRTIPNGQKILMAKLDIIVTKLKIFPIKIPPLDFI